MSVEVLAALARVLGVALVVALIGWFFEYLNRLIYQRGYYYFREQATGLLDDFTAVSTVNEEANEAARERVAVGKHWRELPPNVPARSTKRGSTAAGDLS